LNVSDVVYADHWSARNNKRGVTCQIVGWGRGDVLTFKVETADAFLHFNVQLPENSLDPNGKWKTIGVNVPISPSPSDARWAQGLYQTMRDCLLEALATWPTEDGNIVQRELVVDHDHEARRIRTTGLRTKLDH